MMPSTDTELEPGSRWTLDDQDFREGMNYSHVRDEDLIVELVEVGIDRVKLRHAAGRNKGIEVQVSLDEFLAIYRHIDAREQAILDLIVRNASYTGVEFNGPWEIEICGGCGMLLGRAPWHKCHDGMLITAERAVKVLVVRQVN